MSEILTRKKFERLADSATAYLVNDDTGSAQMAVVQGYYADLLAHDAALRAEVERLTWENGIMRNHDCVAADAERDEFIAFSVNERDAEKARTDAALAECDALAERVKTLEEANAKMDATPSRALLIARVATLEKAIRDFVKKHDELQPHLDGVFSFYAGHGMKWPETLNWTVELDAMRAAAALAGKP